MSRIELIQNRSGYVKHGQDHILPPSLRTSPTTGGVTFSFHDPGLYSRKFTVSGADMQKLSAGRKPADTKYRSYKCKGDLVAVIHQSGQTRMVAAFRVR